MYNNFTQHISLSSSCSQKLLNFICTNAYPYCPVPYACWIGCVNSLLDASYWRACRSECLSIQKNCGPIPNLNCDEYEENDFFCYRVLGNVFLVLTIFHSPNSSFHSQKMTDLLFLCIGSPLESIFCCYAHSVISYTMEVVYLLFTSSLPDYCFWRLYVLSYLLTQDLFMY